MAISLTIIFLLFVCLSIVLIESAPTPKPSPAFPFTAVPPKGKGHRVNTGKKGRINKLI